jgi:hypothetical protein
MNKINILLIILILGLAYGVQNKGNIVGQGFSLAADLTIPKSINFQGYLYRDGNPMDTTMNMWFGIYDDPIAGGILFQQTINNVTVTKGWFTIILDNIPNTVFPVAGPTRYLEVKAPSTGPALSPRISLVSVGYSYHSITADSAEYARTATLSRPITPPISGIEIAKPCTLSTSVSSPNAVLRIKNTGTGNAISIDSAGSNGIYINRAGSNGVSINRVGSDGLSISRAGSDGIQIDSAAYYGIRILRAGYDGVWISRAGDNGVQVDSANYGFYVTRANTGLKVFRVSDDGVNVDSAGYNGVNVNRADYDGVLVDSANQNGFRVLHAGNDGVSVISAHYDGVSVDSAGDAGVEVNRAGVDAFRVFLAGRDGVYVDSASDNGFSIYGAGQYGVFVDQAGGTGIYIGSAGNYGVFAHGGLGGGNFYAGNAGAEGLYAHAYNNISTDTAIRAYGKGIASGGWSTGFDDGKEAPCIISPELNIIANGTAKLQYGKAEISYPEIFKDNIRNDIPVRINLTPRGEPSGLLYLNKTDANGFQAKLRKISEWGEATDITFDWIAIGTLKEPETSPEAKTEWEKMMREREERRKEKAERRVGGMK